MFPATFLLWVAVGIVAGILAGRVLSAHGFGVGIDIAAGVIGALLGGYAAGLAGLGPNLLLQVVAALLGALFLLVMMKAIGFGRGRTPYVF